MKTLRFTILTCLLAITNFSFAQTGLFVNDSTMFFNSDTAAQGSSLIYSLQIVNGSPSTTYTGNITIQIYNDSTGGGGFGTLVKVDSSYIQAATIIQGGSMPFSDSLLISDSAGFRSGINTVVIWPVASDGSGFATLDSVRHNIFMVNPLLNKNILLIDKITLYPNPFSSKIWFKGLDKNSTEQVRVLNLLGEEIMTLEAKESTAIDLSELARGIYFIKLQCKDGKQIIIKTIKE